MNIKCEEQKCYQTSSSCADFSKVAVEGALWKVPVEGARWKAPPDGARWINGVNLPVDGGLEASTNATVLAF